MEHILIIFSFLLILSIIISIINEKFFKLSTDIALISFSFLFFLVIRIIVEIFKIDLSSNTIYSLLKEINLHEFLTEGVLCFMLFANASRLKFKKLVNNIKTVSALGFFTSVAFSLIFGTSLYIILKLLGLNLNFIYCILLGAILTPSEPFAILHSLSKKGFDKTLETNLEGEALINDGVGIALFVFFKHLITSKITFTSVLELLFLKIFGAVLIGFVISFLFFKLFTITKNPIIHIYISLATVMICFVLCEHFGFSGDMACVVSGIYFSYKRQQKSNYFSVIDNKGYYDHFWKIVDSMLNSILFVLLGSYILIFNIDINIIILSLLAVLLNIVSRYLSVILTTIPFSPRALSNYSKSNFSLITSWFGLKGGVSLALALSTAHFLNNNIYLFIIWSTYITVCFSMVIQGILANKILTFVNMLEKDKDIKKFKGEKAK
ncbi:MAG: cation:proton antiporter [Clostridia bacterium]|nr:cation:proton antiporter [Clostridia bacterium]